MGISNVCDEISPYLWMEAKVWPYRRLTVTDADVGIVLQDCDLDAVAVASTKRTLPPVLSWVRSILVRISSFGKAVVHMIPCDLTPWAPALEFF